MIFLFKKKILIELFVFFCILKIRPATNKGRKETIFSRAKRRLRLPGGWRNWFLSKEQKKKSKEKVAEDLEKLNESAAAQRRSRVANNGKPQILIHFYWQSTICNVLDFHRR